MVKFILASASPRRVDLLEQIGLCVDQQFTQQAAAIDESRLPGEAPKAYVLRVALAKARAIYDLRQTEAKAEPLNAILETALLPVLGADTTVALGERIFTKPANKTQAIETLLALSGRRHQVLSAVAICGLKADSVESKQALFNERVLSESVSSERVLSDTVLSESWVSFKHLSQAQCEDYWATGEPEGKAGAYAIQGRAASFITRIEGSYSGVVGLPLAETVDLLARFGVFCGDDSC